MFLNNILNEVDNFRCYTWTQKIYNFHKFIGRGLFLFESLQIIYIALKIKDPYFLINWIVWIFYKISFWKHRLFFHYIKYIFNYFFYPLFIDLNMKGIKFKLKGKISVGGNSRTRTIVCKIGKTTYSTYDNKILHSFKTINTFTGVLGLQIWLIF